MRRRLLDQKLGEMDRRGVWAFTPATFSALLGNPKQNYLRLMMKRLADQGVLIRAARGVYVNPHARSMPSDVRGGLLRFLRPRELTYVSLESKLSDLETRWLELTEQLEQAAGAAATPASTAASQGAISLHANIKNP